MVATTQERHSSIKPKRTWEVLQNESAYLVDVRTQAEWTFVGVPNLADVPSVLLKIEWLSFPDSIQNSSFFTTLEEQLGEKHVEKNDLAIFFLCRSGHRSLEATKEALERGFQKALNVFHGFEGDKDDQGIRGNINGWKKDTLPWHQS